jgi:hypothetical protein
VPHVGGQITPWGPMINVMVGASGPRAVALAAASQPVPAPILARLVVDTGASLTSVDCTILAQLALTAKGTTPIHTPSTQGQPHIANQFDVSMIIYGQTTAVIVYTSQALPVLDGAFKAQGIDGLLGRDILESARLSYFGADGFYAISF